MYANGKFHHREWLDVFLESKFCEVAINKKFKILLSEIEFQIQVKNFWGIFSTENGVC